MGPYVLLVDDSPTIRKLLRFVLKRQGYEVLTACDGMEALELLTWEHVDMLITDLNIPNVDGCELIRCIREDTRRRDMPIIILCSEQRVAERQEGLEAGANSYLAKPFTTDTIRREVARYLKLRVKCEG